MRKKELLFRLTKKDFIVQTFRSGGKGGQHQNKTDSGVRIIHPVSGAVGESRSERSQYRNRRLAFRRLVDSKKFRVWHKLACAELIDGKSIEREVRDWMRPENLKVEVFKDGQWRECRGPDQVPVQVFSVKK